MSYFEGMLSLEQMKNVPLKKHGKVGYKRTMSNKTK
jgi:hypothetical protein